MQISTPHKCLATETIIYYLHHSNWSSAALKTAAFTLFSTHTQNFIFIFPVAVQEHAIISTLDVFSAASLDKFFPLQ